ncbi:MAG TPA: DUF4157 domain-containing protein [Chloroflexota bacterium]|nr:DUF4157 domain-containing protein [Chloroflexota bacterium]
MAVARTRVRIQQTRAPALAVQRQASWRLDPSPDAQRLGHRFERVAPTRPEVPLAPPRSGRPLPPGLRARMEAAFGQDFGGVRLHEGPEAARVGALAYTRGEHLHFAPGLLSPASDAGQRLIAHELTHVVQQRAGRVAAPAGGGAPINADPALEAEAEAAGARAARGEPAAVGGAASGSGAVTGQAAPVQRKTTTKEKLKEAGNTFLEGASHVGQVGTIAQGIGDATGRAPNFNAALGIPSLFALKDAVADAREGIEGARAAYQHGDKLGGAESATRAASGIGGAANAGLSAAQTIGTLVENYGPPLATNVAQQLGTFTNVAVPGVGTAMSGLETGARVYQGVRAQQRKSALEEMLDIERLQSAKAFADPSVSDERLDHHRKTMALLEYAARTQEKRRNRAALNATSAGLITAGGVTALAAGSTGVGAAVGAGLAATGVGLKYGAGLTRTLKQRGRDWAAQQAEEVLSGERQRMSPVARMFNSRKSSAAKEAELASHVEHLEALRGGDRGHLAAEVLRHLGASEAQLHEFQTGTDADKRREMVRALFKKRE